MIIGVVGKKGSGKTTAAKLAEKLGFIPLAFADALKNTTSKVFNIPVNILNDNYAKDNMQITIELTDSVLSNFLWELSNTYTPIHPTAIEQAIADYAGPRMMSTPRQLLQVLGTDLVRDNVDKEYWLNALLSKIKNPKLDYIVHDVRFQNECDLIKRKNGAVLVITRPGGTNLDSHVSESFKPAEYDFLINNNSSIDQFTRDVTNVLRLAKLNGSKI